MKYLLPTLLVIMFADLAAQDIKAHDFSIGESLEIYSEQLDETRTLNVYLPVSYHPDSTRSYPVIYLLDGSEDEDFIHVAGLVQFCSFSWIQIIPESIVVGIANVDRKRDFTYPSGNEIDNRELPSSGGSEKFIRFIETELKPLIHERYPVEGTTTLIGQSLGGLLATEILFDHTELFDNYIIVSPSLWWDDQKLLERDLANSFSSKSIYIAVGNEGPVMIPLAEALYEKLMNYEKTGPLYYKFLEEQDHGDALHLSVYDAFEKIFNSDKD